MHAHVHTRTQSTFVYNMMQAVGASWSRALLVENLHLLLVMWHTHWLNFQTHRDIVNSNDDNNNNNNTHTHTHIHKLTRQYTTKKKENLTKKRNVTLTVTGNTWMPTCFCVHHWFSGTIQWYCCSTKLSCKYSRWFFGVSAHFLQTPVSGSNNWLWWKGLPFLLKISFYWKCLTKYFCKLSVQHLPPYHIWSSQ